MDGCPELHKHLMLINLQYIQRGLESRNSSGPETLEKGPEKAQIQGMRYGAGRGVDPGTSHTRSTRGRGAHGTCRADPVLPFRKGVPLATAVKKLSDLNDNALVAAHLEGHPGAFAELYDRYHDRLV